MKVVTWWSKHSRVDYLLGAAASGGYLALRSGGVDPLVVLDGEARSSLYGSLVDAAGGVLAFAVVPAAIVLAVAPGPRLKVLLDDHSEDLRGATIQAAVASLLMFTFAIAGQALDVQSANSVVRYLAFASSVMLLSSALRLIDMFSILLRNIGRDRSTPTGEQLPAIDKPAPPPGVSARPVSGSGRARRTRRLTAAR